MQMLDSFCKIELIQKPAPAQGRVARYTDKRRLGNPDLPFAVRRSASAATASFGEPFHPSYCITGSGVVRKGPSSGSQMEFCRSRCTSTITGPVVKLSA